MPGFTINGFGNQREIPNNLETARNYRWYIRKLGPITSMRSLIVAKECTLPRWEPQKQEIEASLKYKYAKSINWSDVIISFYDTFTDPILDQLNKWRDKVYTNNAGVKKHGGGGYKDDTVILQLDGSGNEIREITLKGSWPLSIDQGKLSMADNNITLVEVTLSIDYAEIGPTVSIQVGAEPPPGGGLAIGGGVLA